MSNYVCPSCGTPIDGQSNFCTKCGAPLPSASENPQDSYQQPQETYKQPPQPQNNYQTPPPPRQQQYPNQGVPAPAPGNFFQDKVGFDVKNMEYSSIVSKLLAVLAGIASILSMLYAPLFMVKASSSNRSWLAVDAFGKYEIEYLFTNTVTIASIFFVICATLLAGAVLFIIFKKSEYALCFSILYVVFMLIYYISVTASMIEDVYMVVPSFALVICFFSGIGLCVISIVNLVKTKNDTL